MKPNTLSSLIFRNTTFKNIFSFNNKCKGLNQLKNKMTLNKNISAQKIYSMKLSSQFTQKQIFKFSEQKKGPLKPQQIPKQYLEVVQTEQKVQDQEVQVFHTKGTLSILDKVPGGKNSQSGELYVLMFTCGQCNAKQIKSFTKNSYHKGVVLVRCEGCQKIHLVADNLGWFEDEPVNIQTMHKQKVKRVHDPAVISMFLQKAFGQEKQLLHVQSTQNKQEVKQQKKL